MPRCRFFCDALGLQELSRRTIREGRYTLIFFAAPGDESAQIELTHNWDPESYTGGRNFGHVAYAVDDIYATCKRLAEHGVTIQSAAAGRSYGLREVSREHLDRTITKGCGA